MGEAPPVPGVEAIPGAVAGTVLESRVDAIPVGSLVQTMDGGWAERVALAATKVRVVELHGEPLSAHLGVLGMPGLTAWAGMTQLAGVGPGDVVLVDAAAGPVGGTVGQIAQQRGASRVVGIAGGPEKCALVTEVYGFDACIDYKADGWQDELARVLPVPVTVYFENVSTAMATFGLSRLATNGVMVLCGLVDQYHADAPPPGLPAGLIVGKRAEVKGLVVYDFYHRWAEFLAEVQPAVARGDIVIAEDVAFGLEAAPAQFQKLLEGRHLGKALVNL
jgi:hypothetical protein